MSLSKYLPLAFSVAPLTFACISRAQMSAPVSAPASTYAPLPVPLRALIVGGGASPSQSQAGIESNARYLGSLLPRARGARLLWNNGLRHAATVASVSDNRDAYRAHLALAFALGEDWPREVISFRAPKLPRLDGGVSQSSVGREIASLGRSLGAGETALLYFTGHGSPGSNPSLASRIESSITGRAGSREGEEDFENTLYWMWGNRPLSVRALAPMLQAIPARNPLVVVMVQCHAGGFANLMFQNGDHEQPLEARDLCGFFASTAQRMSSGCTASMDEAGSEDFTTHFFAALSGRGRGQRAVLESDFDRNGRTSMLEAFAYANLHDRSIDVPTCTSKEFLMRTFPPQASWYRTPFSALYARAAPWQQATLRGLSRELNLSGEDRLRTARRSARRLAQNVEAGESEDFAWSKGLLARARTLRYTLERREPRLERVDRSAGFSRARTNALKYLQARPELWRDLARDIERESTGLEAGEVREAMLSRFVDAGLTLVAEQKLAQSGTPEQKAAFARLRASEGRSLFATR